MAICTRHSFLHIYKVSLPYHISEALEAVLANELASAPFGAG